MTYGWSANYTMGLSGTIWPLHMGASYYAATSRHAYVSSAMVFGDWLRYAKAVQKFLNFTKKKISPPNQTFGTVP